MCAVHGVWGGGRGGGEVELLLSVVSSTESSIQGGAGVAAENANVFLFMK